MRCKDLTLFPYRTVFRWVKDQNPTQDKPVYIPKYGGRSKVPFRVWPFAGCLLLMSGEKAMHEAQYILTPEKWRSFVDFVKKNPEMGMGEVAKHFKDFGCTNKVFWPAIISICKEYQRNNK